MSADYRSFYMKWLILLLCSFSLAASIIKKPPMKEGDLSYTELACTDVDRTVIFEIISTVGETGKLSLFFKRDHLRELGSRIEHVHPLKFLSTIFGNPHLKMCMIDIYADSFKKSEFLGGLVPNLTLESQKGKLNQYISEFGADIHVPPESLKPYFDSKDWDSLVHFLIHS